MDYKEIVGFAAGTIAIISLLPQVVQCIKSKSTGDLSINMIILLNLSGLLWIIYGFLISSLALMITQVMIYLQSLILLVLKLKYR